MAGLALSGELLGKEQYLAMMISGKEVSKRNSSQMVVTTRLTTSCTSTCCVFTEVGASCEHTRGARYSATQSSSGGTQVQTLTLQRSYFSLI
jgi:hypothetical protein